MDDHHAAEMLRGGPASHSIRRAGNRRTSQRDASSISSDGAVAGRDSPELPDHESASEMPITLPAGSRNSAHVTMSGISVIGVTTSPPIETALSRYF